MKDSVCHGFPPFQKFVKSLSSFAFFSGLLFFSFSVSSSFSQTLSDTSVILKHLRGITRVYGNRDHTNLYALNKTADYIKNEFAKNADTVFLQEFEVNVSSCKNVICSFGIGKKERIIIGAHYDVCDEQEGADDNASGVAGLLELSRLLKNHNPGYRIDLVAYSLEEPPYFGSEFMGSYFHSKSLIENNVSVFGTISLEMIGYYSNEKNSQDNPLKFLKLRTKKFIGPSWLTGVDFSDHRNYWKYGISALMITDTAFYRNRNYHQKSDTIETLDLDKMRRVIDGVFLSLKNFTLITQGQSP